jgi:hypothetical protein
MANAQSAKSLQSLEEALFDPQRAIRTFGNRPYRTLGVAFASSLFFLPPLLWQLHSVAEFWHRLFSALMGWCGIALRPAAEFNFGGYSFGSWLPSMAAQSPGLAQWLFFIVVAAGLHFGGKLLPDRFRPVTLWMSLIAAIASTAIIYFAWRPADFPYDFALYYRARAAGTLVLLLLAPPILGLLYYPIDRSWLRRFVMTAAYLGFIVAAFPFELVLVALACKAFSVAVLPLMFILIGPVLQIIWFAAFFSYGVSGIDANRLD